ncbi:hypothetical protein QJS10_CPA01g01882 [Acorus calamus]|uniref:30S ribosomal protein S6 alpha, chloroplastic n=1 Tax=Acorus calamus TaxID=4465 RepID=A0AAV9FLR3_ACOCL|nr:hypothetical protein QJS10_CPA01g01882 [Acorus calamus]
MASVSSTLSTPHILSSSSYSPSLPLRLPFPSFRLRRPGRKEDRRLSVRALTLDFSGSFFESVGDEDGDPPSMSAGVAAAAAAVEDKEEPQCPPGLRHYETMAVLRPDMSEDERLTLTQRYEELLVAGGGMYVEVFNRGVIPLAYSIKKKNKAGETNTYLDGIYLLFTYFTKPESMAALETRLNMDDDVIRSSSFKIRKRKY